MNIAVLMATYHGEKYLRAQIESIIGQKVNADVNVDLIVRDDGSNDGTINILETYAQSGVLRYSVGSNLGAAKGFITMVKENPQYDFYAFSDQDDVWNEDKLQRAIDTLKKCGEPALYASNATLVNSELQKIGRNVRRKVPVFNPVNVLCQINSAHGCTCVFNKKLAEIVQNHNVPAIFTMHDSLLTCLCELVGGTLIYDHTPSLLYRMHGANVVGLVTAKQSVFRVLRKRITEITKKEKNGIYSQTQSILDTYSDVICEENQKLCRTVIASEHALGARLILVFDKNLKHESANKTIARKLKILLGNG